MEVKNEPWNFLAGLKFFGSFYRMATVISIGLFLGYSIYFLSRQNSTQTIISTTDKRRIELPDRSVIILKKDAEITYNKSFSSINRLISFSGEAIFEIQRDTLRPFIIRINNISIRVLGTSFAVKANPESPEIEMIVFEGKIALYEGSDRVNEKTIFSGEKAVYNKLLKKISIIP
jgi:transmembrane sensor